MARDINAEGYKNFHGEQMVTLRIASRSIATLTADEARTLRDQLTAALQERIETVR